MEIYLDTLFLTSKNNLSLLKNIHKYRSTRMTLRSELARKHVEQNKANRNKDMLLEMRNRRFEDTFETRSHQDDEKKIVQSIVR